MSFVPFNALDSATQDRIVRDSGTKIDIEPVVFHCEGKANTTSTSVIHLQVGESHVILRPAEVEDFFLQFRRALLVVWRLECRE